MLQQSLPIVHKNEEHQTMFRVYGCSNGRPIQWVMTLLLAAILADTSNGQKSGVVKPPSKQPVTHADYDSWRSLNGSQLSRDGRYVAYSIIPQDGDGEVVVR